VLAANLLRLKGYRILDRRVKTRAGEIDLVAKSLLGPVCFIEVKTRRDQTSAAFALTSHQAKRIARAAELYLANRPGLERHGIRFDIITVSGALPRHLRDAWRADSEGA